MIKIKLPNYLFINALLLAVGIIAILLSIIYGGPVVRPVLESIGIGLLAAAAVNLLDRFFSVEVSDRSACATSARGGGKDCAGSLQTLFDTAGDFGSKIHRRQSGYYRHHPQSCR